MLFERENGEREERKGGAVIESQLTIRKGEKLSRFQSVMMPLSGILATVVHAKKTGKIL